MMDSVFADLRVNTAQMWSRLDNLGLVRLTGPESVGGSGAGWPEAAELLSAAVRHGVRVPLAEHDLLACWLLDATATVYTPARRTLALLDADGRADGVPWCADAERIVVVWPCAIDGADGYRLADVEPSELSITKGANMIGEPRDTVVATGLSGVPVDPGLVAKVRHRAALIRAIQVCAALDRSLELSIEHVSSRVQFGRPLAKFQAIQNLISDIAAESALARAATEAALSRAIADDWAGRDVEFAVAVARSCAGHAASVAVRNAHQVHGAIGTTIEHRLHEYTRATLAWRSEYGSVRYWDQRVADLAGTAPDLWGLIAPAPGARTP
ncbi:MAG: acyl-CoA dehydrogenase family protein [Mycobacterium sp.]